MAEQDVEQPGTSSVPDEAIAQDTVETPAPEPQEAALEAAPEAPAKRGAKQRIQELVTERNAERMAREAAERRIRELEYAAPHTQSAPVDEYGDPLVAEVRQMRSMLEQVQRETAYARDARQREEFWSDHDYVADEIVEAVETTLTEFRSKGLNAVKREDLLQYEIGRRELPNLRKRMKAPAFTPPVNRVAVVEGGASAPATKSSKRLEDMTPAELNALPLEKLRELMKDVTF